jgi:hypothetical protein
MFEGSEFFATPLSEVLYTEAVAAAGCRFFSFFSLGKQRKDLLLKAKLMVMCKEGSMVELKKNIQLDT